ncbi:type II and III secretion system protein family protein [Dechloromonas sp. XY25]|uniref:Type II and III secretion system protein family protein n=1 Tax=Dechloromonas hankyongensis TaxID=2908002 RepID=A0ABS9JZX9_9RHOO|nr:type II and III secretion system protein family protein [Dechloromonas hankyongensis]MCG2576465.1 type II and III secretion system protein family protein [Dechloromonas hankyongensis]
MKSVIFPHCLTAALLATAFAQGAAHAAPAPHAPPAASATGASPCGRVEIGPMVKLAVGKASLLKLETPVSRILLGNPENAAAARPGEGAANANPAGRADAGGGQQNVRRPGVADVDALLLSPREIYLLGKTVGSTNIAMLDRSGRCIVVDVTVGMDTAALAASLKELMPGEEQIRISSAADSVVLAGTVSDALAADRAVDIAGAYVRRTTGGGTVGTGRAAAHDRIINMLSIAAPQQVMLEVKVAEVSKSLLDQFGINFARAYSPADGSMIRFLSGLFGGKGIIAQQVSGTTGAMVGSGVASTLSGGSATASISAPVGDVRAVNGNVTQWPIIAGKNATSFSSDAQKQDGLLKVLAEPTVMAISGQEGSFLAGGKIFIPVASNSGTGGTAITLEEKEFGVSLKFTPTVLGDGRINLKVNPEVSELNSQGVAITATNVAGTAILPSFTTRRASTTVQLMDGQSFAIGGLMKNNVTANLTAFPFLGELPVLGALFRSTSYQNDRSELVFVITPRLVRPLPPNYALPTDGFVPPSRTDVIVNGRLEGSGTASSLSEIPAGSQPGTASRDGFEVK